MHRDKVSSLIQLFTKIQYLCTTADVWTSHNRSYLGVTGHWIDPVLLTRRSAALACSRLLGHLTYDVLAGALDAVHAKFGIREKAVMAVMDNGANFVKAFSTYSDENAISNIDDADQTQLVQENNGEVVLVEVGPILDDNNVEQECVLPPHQRCGAHTMNLIAVKDTEAACADASYKKISRNALAKCAGLWNKASRSTVAAKAVLNAVKFALIVPNATRWNSYYQAVDKVCDVVRKHSETTLNDICTSISVALFRPVDIAFILEYSHVMQPVAQALDILQSEDKCYIGILLPTLVSLKKQLLKAHQGLKLALPLVDALLRGIETRFQGYFDRKDLILASLTHPLFKLRWLEDADAKERARQLFLNAMKSESEKVCAAQHQSTTCTSEQVAAVSDADSFFYFEEVAHCDNSCSTILAEMDMFLADSSRDISCLANAHYPLVKSLFLRYNTGMPSSAPVERLFSLGGQILTPRRNRLSDENFEMQLLLRANKSIV